MSSKKNKIVLLVGIISIFILLGWGYQNWHKTAFRPNSKIQSQPDQKHYHDIAIDIDPKDLAHLSDSEKLNVQYDFCKMLYLGKPQRYSNGSISIPPQVFCRVKNDKVTLIKNDQAKDSIKAGDSIIFIVNLPKLFQQEYFDIMSTDTPLLVPKNDFNICVSYKPYLSTVFGFPKDSNHSTNTPTSCFFVKSLSELHPIGLIANIPNDNKGESLGMNIFLPTENLHTTDPLDAREIIQNKHFVTLYEMIEFSQ